MSAPVQGLEAAALAPSRLGIGEAAYADMIAAIVAQLQSGDDEQSAHQTADDVQEAEWIVGLLHKAGFKPVRIGATP